MPNQELKEALKQAGENMTDQIEIVQIRAQLCREYYLELREQGFLKEEALELCKYFTL